MTDPIQILGTEIVQTFDLETLHKTDIETIQTIKILVIKIIDHVIILTTDQNIIIIKKYHAIIHRTKVHAITTDKETTLNPHIGTTHVIKIHNKIIEVIHLNINDKILSTIN